MKHQQITGIILRKVRTKEHDQSVVIFCKELGKIYCVARGAQKITSKRVGLLDTCNVITAQLSQNHSIWYLREADLISRLQGIKDTKQRDYLLFLTEVLDKLLPYEQVEEAVYTKVVRLLNNLITDLADTDFIQSVSEIMKVLGYEGGSATKHSLPLFINYIQTVTEREMKSKYLVS